jgi:hypothetical protein
LQKIQLCDRLKGGPRDESHGGKAERLVGEKKPWRREVRRKEEVGERGRKKMTSVIMSATSETRVTR